jgi:predicted nuclease with TOPRIM domain
MIAMLKMTHKRVVHVRRAKKKSSGARAVGAKSSYGAMKDKLVKAEKEREKLEKELKETKADLEKEKETTRRLENERDEEREKRHELVAEAVRTRVSFLSNPF